MRRAISIFSSLTILAVTPSVATAATTAQGGYSSTPIAVPEGPSGPTVAGATVTRSGASTSPSASGTLPTAAATPAAEISEGALPFTGLDVGVIAALAITLMGLGLVLRRTTRTNE